MCNLNMSVYTCAYILAIFAQGWHHDLIMENDILTNFIYWLTIPDAYMSCTFQECTTPPMHPVWINGRSSH